MGISPEILKTIATETQLAESRELADDGADFDGEAAQGRRARRRAIRRETGAFRGDSSARRCRASWREICVRPNRADAISLKDAATKQRIAQALFDGIGSYQSSLKISLFYSSLFHFFSFIYYFFLLCLRGS